MNAPDHVEVLIADCIATRCEQSLRAAVVEHCVSAPQPWFLDTDVARLLAL